MLMGNVIIAYGPGLNWIFVGVASVSSCFRKGKRALDALALVFRARNVIPMVFAKTRYVFIPYTYQAKS